jgi:uncharacterized protein YkwD
MDAAARELPMKLRATLLALLLLASFPVSATATHTTTHVRCDKLVDRVNVYRAKDLRLAYTLCRVGWQRVKAMAEAGRIWHDLRPVVRALNAAGICWRNVGEVVAWNNYSASAGAFVAQWKASPPHWDLLMGTRYDRGGGSWIIRNGRNYAALYVVDTCP